MPDNRKGKFADRSVQAAILLRLLMYWVLFVVASSAFLLFVDLLTRDPREVAQSIFSRHGPTVLAMLVLAPIFIRDLCKLTNRFAGPVVRLRRAMHDVAEGRELGPLKFREGDFWSELAVDFNRLVERVKAVEKSSEQPYRAPALTTSKTEGGCDA